MGQRHGVQRHNSSAVPDTMLLGQLQRGSPTHHRADKPSAFESPEPCRRNNPAPVPSGRDCILPRHPFPAISGFFLLAAGAAGQESIGSSATRPENAAIRGWGAAAGLCHPSRQREAPSEHECTQTLGSASMWRPTLSPFTKKYLRGASTPRGALPFKKIKRKRKGQVEFLRWVDGSAVGLLLNRGKRIKK